MKYAAIDIGSNSVRLLSQGVKCHDITTLGEGLIATGRLKEEAIERTAQAVESYYARAKAEGADVVYVFATQAVRAASNGNDFVNRLARSGIKVDIVPKDKEAEIGFLGAYTSGMCAIIDIGGASTEIAIGDESGIVFKGSIAVGAVTLKDVGDDRVVMEDYVKELFREYGKLPPFDKLVAIGGTPTTYAAIYHDLEIYDPSVVDGTVVSRQDMYDITSRIENTPFEARKHINGLQEKKVLYAVTSGVLLYTFMDCLGVEQCEISEKDNLEGYIKLKTLS